MLDAELRQPRSSTFARKPFADASVAEASEEQRSALEDTLNDQHSSQPPGWISKPGRLGKPRKLHFLDLALDVSMVLIPLPFLILAAVVALAHGKPVMPSKTDALPQATKTV